MNIKRFLLKPEYYWRPTQIVRRLKLVSRPSEDSINLLWGHKNFLINSKETIGRSIVTQGVYDLTLSECIYRLITKKSICVDVGANVGYFTSLMSYFGDRVYAFEPHPMIYSKLEQNCKDLQNVQLFSLALSEEDGKATLFVPENFNGNEGISSLQPQVKAKEISIQTQRLDNIFPNEIIDILKLDVEGHELSVLRGASKLLSEGRIKYIAFEDFAGTQSRVINELKKQGYYIYRLAKRNFGLEYLSVEKGEDEPAWDPPNYLATKTEKIEKRFGWQILKL